MGAIMREGEGCSLFDFAHPGSIHPSPAYNMAITSYRMVSIGGARRWIFVVQGNPAFSSKGPGGKT